MRCSPADLVAGLPGAGLEAADALQDRMDRKYVVTPEQLTALAGALRGTHAALEIDGRRAFGYETTYFDTPELLAFHEHVQQRRRRFKCRARLYVDSGACTFEVKLKGARGRTVKHRMAYERERRHELSGPALAFLRDCLRRAYGRAPAGVLRQSLVVSCTRFTLLAPGERITCDFGVAFRAPGGAAGRMGADAVIVECKSAAGVSGADRVLRELGARPVEGCSKYCLGVALTHPGVRRNALLPLLRRHFTNT